MEHVWLEPRRNRGWPWPEGSYGLTPMYGEDGWCRGCGIPLVHQLGSIVLKRSSRDNFAGAWLPNWQFEAFCVDGKLGAELVGSYRVRTLPVGWRGSEGDAALQILADQDDAFYFDPGRLEAAAVEVHGEAGEKCGQCGKWKWNPVSLNRLPPAIIDRPVVRDVIIGRDWFGSGLNAFRRVLFSRRLGEWLASSSPRDLRVVPAEVQR